MGESPRLRDLEERGKGSGCATRAGKDRVVGRSTLLDHDIEVDDEGGILDC